MTKTTEVNKFNLNDFMKDLPIQKEEFGDIDGSIFTYNYKQLYITDYLKLILFDSGQATLEYRGHEIETFYYDEESEAMFAKIDELKISELFEMMYGKRWESKVEKV